MTTTFEHLLLKLSLLSPKNRLWVLNALPNNAKRKLRTLLQKDKDTPTNETTQITETLTLPDFCEHLAQYSTLYIATILKQTTPSWQSKFLEMYDSNNTIKTRLLAHPRLKPKSQALILNHFNAHVMPGVGLAGFDGPCKTFEKQDVFLERAMDGESAFYKGHQTPQAPHPALPPKAVKSRTEAHHG